MRRDFDFEMLDACVPREFPEKPRTCATRQKRPEQAGFTLIELMISVAIIGILSSVAVPWFVDYQLRAKGVEAAANLGGMRTSLTAFNTTYGTYLLVMPEPYMTGWGSGTKRRWGSAGWPQVTMAFVLANQIGTFDHIGFRPSGDVYFTYSCMCAPTWWSCEAVADLDGNGLPKVVQYAEMQSSACVAPRGAVPIGYLTRQPITQIGEVHLLTPPTWH